MDFYASLTINRCHLKRMCEIWATRFGKEEFPFRYAIVSPLFVRNGILPTLYEHREQCNVIFDSGGFHVQQGRIRLRPAIRKLRRLYRENNWADRFALPDAPITSMDTPDVVRSKLDSTRRQYRTFPAGFPHSFRCKFLPVVHGTTTGEVHRSMLAARNVLSKSLGFGGFSTSGPNSGVNSCTAQSLRLLVDFVELCKKWNLDSHVFGIGGPAAIAVLRHVSVNSFDSAGWIRTAAYGNVYLPHIGALNITGAAHSRRYVTAREFRHLRGATGHECEFCTDQALLLRSWHHRALHNYCTIKTLTQSLRDTPAQQTLEKLRAFNPRYAGYLQMVLALRRRPKRDGASQGIEVAL